MVRKLMKINKWFFIYKKKTVIALNIIPIRVTFFDFLIDV